jgi:cyclophilin family peptidyl-prolyl cis-trans isomerase/HEAT repeat protein
MAAFALGETESAKATPVIIQNLNNYELPKEIRARVIEAAGKIAAANPKDVQAKLLSETILKTLDHEDKKRDATSRDVSLMGITAVLRSKPENAEKVLIDFLGYSDARMRSDALNALARLRAKNANTEARDLLKTDTDAVVRANAARLLGVAEDKESFDLLVKSATIDADSRVRVSAIRSLANLKDARAADVLINRGGELLKNFAAMKTSVEYPKEKSELLEIFATLGRLLANSGNEKAISLLESFREMDRYSSPETEIAYARIAPTAYLENYRNSKQTTNWRTTSALAQGLGELANQTDEKIKTQGKTVLVNYFVELIEKIPPAQSAEMNKAVPDLLTALAAFKPDNLNLFLLEMINTKDVFVRAAAAGLMAEQPLAAANTNALKKAFISSLLTDKHENDAQLAILDALYKLDKKESVSSLLLALNAPDYLVRQRAIQLIKAGDFAKDYPGIPTMLAKAETTVQPYFPAYGTKLGQILNSNADYARAVSRKNGGVKAVFTTTKGTFTIDLAPEDAPLTVDNFVKLAKSNYFNNVSIHRVVPNFVMQDGDPRGDGNGGPGWQIRCEINMLAYERGAVGMALSGKDTGGSQWFVTHSPQPHLDGGYTVFGKVNETDMKFVDNLVRGDKILSVKIVETVSTPPLKTTKARSGK